ncbi:MAG: hypothetical protein JNK65_05305 [Deltaproteobacteria bacterium]|nr:hypothetical protein [Deltaproteobacteria bacterium]
MFSRLGRILSTIGIIFLVFLVAGLIFIGSQLRDVKKPLIDFLKSQIQGDLQIEEASVVLFPAGINLKQVKLYAPNEKEPAAIIKSARLRFDLLPLIQKKIETRVTLLDPDIRLVQDREGVSNMEKIFSLLLKDSTKPTSSPALDQLWWKRLAVNRLLIDRAQFSAMDARGEKKIELKNLSIKADEIRFENATKPASIQIEYEMPNMSKVPMRLDLSLTFLEAEQLLRLNPSDFYWGKINLKLNGDVRLPQKNKSDVQLSLQFSSESTDLKVLSQNLLHPLPLVGDLKLKGAIEGTAFEPTVQWTLDSSQLNIAGHSIQSLHSEMKKKDKVIEIENTRFKIFGGDIDLSGNVLPAESISTHTSLKIKALSIAAASGKKDDGVRLSGTLQIQCGNIEHVQSCTGEGPIQVGPFALPNLNLQDKVKVAEILASGTAVGQMVNVGMLSSSSNVIGTQIDTVKANISFAGTQVKMAPFSLGNGHFSAAGSGTVSPSSLNASGNATLNSQVTSSLFPDAAFRAAVTGGKNALTLPFRLTGSPDKPDFEVDSAYLRNLIARAAAVGIKNLLLGGVKPQEMLGTALKGTPLADPKNPLGQILGTSSTSNPSQQKTNSNTSSPPKKQNDLKGGLNQFLFGR